MKISVLEGKEIIATQASGQDGSFAFDKLPPATSLSIRFELAGYLRNPTVQPFELRQKDLTIDVFLLKQKDSSALVAARLRERLARKEAKSKEEMAVLDGFGLDELTLNAILDRAAKLGARGLTSTRKEERIAIDEDEKTAGRHKSLNDAIRVALGHIEKTDLHAKKGIEREEQVAMLCVQENAWMAYFQDDEGTLSPVRDTLNTDDDEDWLGLRFTDYNKPRSRLGIITVVDQSPEHSESGSVKVPVSTIQEMLTAALYNTKRFDIIEEMRIQEIQALQTLTAIQEVTPTSIAHIGKAVGAQYLVYATVNEWSPERVSRDTGVDHFFKSGKRGAEVVITLTLMDAASGQMLLRTSERAQIDEWRFGSGVPTEGSTLPKTPLGYAVRASVNKAAFSVATYLRGRTWKGSIVDIKGDDIFIDAGSQQGMVPQARLTVQSVRGIIKDQESGTILGEDLRGIGTLEVIAVQTGFSVARIVEGCKGIKKGDRVEFVTDSVPSRMRPECESLNGQTP